MGGCINEGTNLQYTTVCVRNCMEKETTWHYSTSEIKTISWP